MRKKTLKAVRTDSKTRVRLDFDGDNWRIGNRKFTTARSADRAWEKACDAVAAASKAAKS